MIHKRIVIVCMMLVIAAVHFVTGKNYRGPYPGFVNGYLLDILVPFGFYFLLCNVESAYLRHWAAKGLSVLGIAFSVEIAQYFGVPVFGRTYDPIDFLMYGFGILSAITFDQMILPRVFKFWSPGNIESK